MRQCTVALRAPSGGVRAKWGAMSDGRADGVPIGRV
jgi:hypothetical protein